MLILSILLVIFYFIYLIIYAVGFYSLYSFCKLFLLYYRSWSFLSVTIKNSIKNRVGKLTSSVHWVTVA